MTRTTHNARSDTAMPWRGMRVDRQIIVYEDAASLKRGFQFWLTWPHATGKTCRCVPIYLSQADRPELDELFQPPCESSLFVLSLSSNEAFSPANTRRLLKLTKRDCARQRGLILLFPTAQARSRWFQQWPLYGIQEFPLGCCTAVPTRCVDGNIEVPLNYTLRPAPPRRGLRAKTTTAVVGTRATGRDTTP